MEHMARRKLLAVLLAIAVVAAAWYCVSHLYQADRSRAGTLVQVQETAGGQETMREQSL